MAGWKANVGFQTIALDARYVIPELGIFGNRGGGKTGVVLADYAMNILEHPDPKTGKILQGPCRPWKGIVFRKHYKEFETLIERTKEVYYGLFGNRDDGGRAKYLEGDKKWVFYDEKGKPYNDVFQLLFPVEHDADIDQFIGQEFQHVIWEELPQWASSRPYFKMMASIRAGKPGVPMRVRSTGNPGGPGIGWVKEWFGIPDGSAQEAKRASIENQKIITDPRTGIVRGFLVGMLEENQPLLNNDKGYQARLLQATLGDPELEKAWVHSDFSALFGQYFKVFSPNIHKIDPEDFFPGGRLPAHYKLYGHLDYGENAPTAFGLWAVNPEGERFLFEEHYQAGEWAGYHAGAIKDLCANSPWTGGRMPSIVFADSQIWHTRSAENATARNRTVAKIFENEGGLRLRPSVKGPGSRVRGWRFMKQCLSYVIDGAGRMIKKPTLYYAGHCENWEREVKNAVFSDKGDKEDIDSGCDDHHLTGTIYFLGGSQRSIRPPEETPEEASYATLNYYRQQAKNRAKGRTVETFLVPSNNARVDQLLIA